MGGSHKIRRGQEKLAGFIIAVPGRKFFRVPGTGDSRPRAQKIAVCQSGVILISKEAYLGRAAEEAVARSGIFPAVHKDTRDGGCYSQTADSRLFNGFLT